MARLTATVIPCLRAYGMQETIRFYEILGFEVTSRAEEQGQIAWCEIARDDVRLQFHVLDHPEMPNAPIMSGILYFRPDDVMALASEWGDKVEFYWGPQAMEYGSIEFAFRDPNGYILAFCEDAGSRTGSTSIQPG